MPLSYRPGSLLFLTWVGALLGALLAIYRHLPLQCAATKCPSSNTIHTGYFEYGYASKPHYSSWRSWWHPQWSEKQGQHAGATTQDWNILYHLGGNGPWIEKVDDVVDQGVAVPAGCEAEQVHMISRHAERYPNKRHGRDQKAVVQRMKDSGIHFSGSLAFFNDWELFWSDDSSLEQLTSTGPFSGTLGAFTTGVRLRTRYKKLLSKALEFQNHPIKFWASDAQRVIETARHFALAFFGIDYEAMKIAALEVIPERPWRGADTLTPGRTCLANRHHHEQGRTQGYRLVKEYQAIFLRPIHDRLLKQTSMNFTDNEIWSMMEMCGYEITVRGQSNWCDVFTQSEFLSFEYARDVLHYYRAGPGNKYAASMGSLFLNATMNLMLEGPSAGFLFLSFVHDGDLAPMLAALDIFNGDEPLPTTHIAPNRKWRTSQVLPMGGRVIFELLSCNVTKLSGQREFVRVNINDGIIAIPECDNGPGMSCPLEDFVARTKNKTKEAGDFRELCGLENHAADRIAFLNQKQES